MSVAFGDADPTKFTGCNCTLRDHEMVLVEFHVDLDGTVVFAVGLTGHLNLREVTSQAVL